MNDNSNKKSVFNTKSDTQSKTQSNTQSKRWALIQNDLEKALNKWDEISKNQPVLSQEEQQLAKIKSIINQLKDKLDQF